VETDAGLLTQQEFEQSFTDVREAIQEAIRRSEVRCAAHTDVNGNTDDVDAMLDDAGDALAWAAAAAFLGLDNDGSITAGVINNLCFTVTLDQPPRLEGSFEDATLIVQASLLVKDGSGGFHSPIHDPRVQIRVTPGSTDDVLVQPFIAISEGSIDATGRFATQVQPGQSDPAVVLRIEALLDGVLTMDSADVRLDGLPSIDLKGFLLDAEDESAARDTNLLAPAGGAVELVARLKRGNGPLRDGQLNFYLIGQGTLEQAVVSSGRTGEARVVYVPPADTAGILSATVGVAYFENGQIFRDQINIDFADVGTIGVLTGAISSGLDQVPASTDAAVLAAINAIEAALDGNDPDEIPQATKDGLKPLLKAWFEQVVLPNLTTGLNGSDIDLKLGLSRFLDWQANVGLLGFFTDEIIPVDNPAGTFADADVLVVQGLKNAIQRDKATLINPDGSFTAAANQLGLAPLYDAIVWSVTADLLGMDTETLGLTFNDVVTAFGVTVDLGVPQITGDAESATVSVDVGLKIDDQTPPFATTVLVRVDRLGFASVTNDSGSFSTQGVFTTTAGIGGNDTRLGLRLIAGIPGFDLDELEIDIKGTPNLEVTAFLVGGSGSAQGGVIDVPADDEVNIEVAVRRGLGPLPEAEVLFHLIGAGSLDRTFARSNEAGLVESVIYTPPKSVRSGTAIVNFNYMEDNTVFTKSVLIRYAASADIDTADSQSATEDGEHARAMAALLDPDDVAAFTAGLSEILREWWRGFPDAPEVGSIQSRLDAVQPTNPVTAHPIQVYKEFRAAVIEAIRNWSEWHASVQLAVLDAEEVLAGDPLPNISAAQELQLAEDKLAPAIREAIRRVNELADSLAAPPLEQSMREIIYWLGAAAELGIDTGPDGLNIDNTIRNSVAFPTEDRVVAELAVQIAFLNAIEPVVVTADTSL
ncbi:MAG: hypothetical protein IID45_11535, partial [Planctomycetes bacterium]|nr:hypothetical protein [Planctomycetota bacterium]